MNLDMTILVYSCWKNRDMWDYFSILFKKYWEDCDYKIILLTDKIECTVDEVINRYIFDEVLEKDDTWGRVIKAGIEKASTPYISLFMDDYLLCNHVDNEIIQVQIERAKKYHVANLRLVESPLCKGMFEKDKGLGYYIWGYPYALSTQVGLWDSGFLMSIIKNEWSAWEFERLASLQVPEEDYPILVTMDYTFPYDECIHKGKWMERGWKLCKRNNLVIDESVRPIMTNKEMAIMYARGAIIDMNPEMILKMQNFVEQIRKRKI